jgi:hydroxymethylglutaryl-CoA lyase
MSIDEVVMPGLVPGIHVFLRRITNDVDGRDKPGHDTEMPETR